ncbi:hypothetical protein CH375_13075 [Leptospira ellisii]|uniref:Uncharacterized protein n=1 Tax=Leptospira ellisii TaxID=2023197 RepID=A0A2N0BJ98_9LEPT|nr:hypothetical protein CH379_16030 [Leptospira ellisii]PKA04089.1 hypothetical protein CH375_13075 [Leptospira ellisii]
MILESDYSEDVRSRVLIRIRSEFDVFPFLVPVPVSGVSKKNLRRVVERTEAPRSRTLVGARLQGV